MLTLLLWVYFLAHAMHETLSLLWLFLAKFYPIISFQNQSEFLLSQFSITLSKSTVILDVYEIWFTVSLEGMNPYMFYPGLISVMNRHWF